MDCVEKNKTRQIWDALKPSGKVALYVCKYCGDRTQNFRICKSCYKDYHESRGGE